jgi:TRAP-type C4-dicarboxylate transport system permease large subunit
VFAALERKLSFEAVRTACLNTVKQTSMILLVIMMAKVLALTLIYSRVPNMAAEWVQQLGVTTTLIILATLALYLIMGMFFDGVSMMVITVPFIVPIMNAANVDLVWLGVLICINIEVGLLTPPVGLNLYVLQGSTGEPFRTIVSGSWPFATLQVLVMLTIFMLPAIATWLPARLF